MAQAIQQVLNLGRNLPCRRLRTHFLGKFGDGENLFGLVLGVPDEVGHGSFESSFLKLI